jgi:predicted Zn-dependent peptidase
MAYLHPERVEVSVSGDFSGEVVEELAARYLGSLPPFDPESDKPPPATWNTTVNAGAAGAGDDTTAGHPKAPTTVRF